MHPRSIWTGAGTGPTVPPKVCPPEVAEPGLDPPPLLAPAKAAEGPGGLSLRVGARPGSPLDPLPSSPHG